MKKHISTIICLAVCLGFGVLSYSQYQQSQKEIVRSRFLENKSLVDFFILGKSFSRHKQALTDPLSVKIMNTKYFDGISSILQYFSPLYLISTSPDYKEILETGLYLEGGSIEAGGHYNIENLMDSIDSFSYSYNIESIKDKGRGRYDICIYGAFAYSSTIYANTGNAQIIRGPYRISTCYPFILKNGNILIDTEELAKTQITN